MTKVFSFCLYGSNPKYNVGMIENIKIINKMFNDWFIYIYYNNVPIVQTVGNVINILLGFLSVLAVVAIVIGGFKVMTSGGNEE